MKMAGKSKTVKTEKSDYYSKTLRRNQILFGMVAVILILSMALSLVKF
jgi:hypothetical protein